MIPSPHPERHREISSGWARAAIFGVSDGLVTNVSLILGFAGASPGHSVVRLAGLAGMVAGAFSMACGEYISMTSQRELYEREIDVERRALATYPAAEEAELRAIFLSRGIDADLATRMATELMKDPDTALRAHTREELGIDPSSIGSPWRAAISSLGAFALGALLPLLPWLLTSAGDQTLWSILLGAAGTLGVGGIVGAFTQRGVARGAIRQLAVTSVAAAVTWSVGHAVGVSRG